MKKYSQILNLFLDWGLIIALGILISLLAGMWNGYPIGMDSLAHLTKAKFIMDNWPNIDWSGQWYNGVPMFLWYSVVPYFFIVVFAKLAGSYLLGIQLLTLAAVISIPLSAYMTVKRVTNSRISALLSAFMIVVAPALWGRMAMGEVPRLVATAMMTWSWYMVIDYWLKGRKSYAAYLLTIMSIALALAGHFIMTGLTVMTLLIMFYFMSGGWKVWWEKIETLLIPAIVLSLGVTMPFLLATGLSQVFHRGFIGGDVTHPLLDLTRMFWHNTVYIDRLDWVNNDYGAGLYWLMPPLLIGLLYLAIRRKQKLDQISDEWRILKAFFYISMIFLAYGIGQYAGVPSNWYNTAFPPTDAYYYLGIIWPIVIGIALHFAFRMKTPKKLVFITACLSLVLIIIQLYPCNGIRIKQGNYRYYNLDNRLSEEFDQVFTDQEHRTAENNSFVSTWFSFATDNPETNGYYAQGMLDRDFSFYMNDVLFARSDNWKETKFMLDWYGVKYIIEQFPNFNFAKLKEWPRYFEEIFSNQAPEHNLMVEVYEYYDPKPLMEATNAPTMLVIGDDQTYQEVWRALSQTDLTSTKLIPIKGQPIIDLYDLDELKRFDMLLLHNFSFIEKKRAYDLLDKYVELGGKVMIETSPIMTDQDSEYVFPPMPVKQVHAGQADQVWDLHILDESISSRIDLGSFGPASYGENQPWSLLYANQSDLKDEAKTLMTNNDQIVMAELNKGKGKVIWSGLNLFYHINSYRSPDEVELLENIINSLIGETSPTNQPGNIINSWQRQITIGDPEYYTGVLLKENYFSAWRANIKNGQYDFEPKIYPAGPDMMYIDLNPNLTGPTTVTWYYFTPWYQCLGYLISVSYLAYLSSKLFDRKPPELIIGQDSLSQKKNIQKKKKKRPLKRTRRYTAKQKVHFTVVKI